MTAPYVRIGQIVPSSNTTMETEIPTLFRARETVAPERFTFHSSRMRMKKVTKAELEAMDRDSDRCALELSDARMDVLGYACLVAIMSMGKGYHRESEARLHGRTVENGGPAPVVTSAGALILKYQGVDAVVLSACVQMPSLGAIGQAEQRIGLPVVSASVCTAFQMMERLGLPAVAPGGGTLLSGRYGPGADRSRAA